MFPIGNILGRGFYVGHGMSAENYISIAKALSATATCDVQELVKLDAWGVNLNILAIG